MELTSPANIKDILSRHETRPSKGLGQNFLIDKNVLRKIIEASNIQPNDVILEVGPGIGTLTRELAQRAGRVIAIEKDETMVEILKETLKDFNNVEASRGDILESELELPKKYKIVANIPYYLTSPLIRKFLESKIQPEAMVLMLQKEVAQRICSKPGEMSLLAVSVQFYADAKIVSYVPKNCFWPAPKIDSAIIKITPRRNKEKENINADLFFKVVKAGFSHPRKQLANNLSEALNIGKTEVEKWLFNNEIKPSQRAETLSVEDWIRLAKSGGVDIISK